MGSQIMSRVLIWDIPTRLFHWLLAVGFLLAAGIALLGGKHGSLFHYHAIIGVILAGLLLFRLLWGIIGTRHARFTAFAYGPVAVIIHLKNMLTGKADRYAGHNPLACWAIYAMLALVAVIVGSGLLMAGGYKGFKDAHSMAVYVLLAVVGVHVLGVIVHTLRYRENITLAMITGRKQAEPSAAIRSARPISGALFLTLFLLLTAGLFNNYDPGSRQTTIPLIGTNIQLDKHKSKKGHPKAPKIRKSHDR